MEYLVEHKPVIPGGHVDCWLVGWAWFAEGKPDPVWDFFENPPGIPASDQHRANVAGYEAHRIASGEHEIVLTPEESKAVVEMLQRPPVVNENLRRLLSKRRSNPSAE